MSREGSSDYHFDEYYENGNQTPAEIPEGASPIEAFATVLADGSLTDFVPNPDGCKALAIGGWNGSVQSKGLYEVMTSPEPSVRAHLIQQILAATKKKAFKRVVLAYENYAGSPRPDPAIYTHFLEALGKRLHAAHPSVQLDIVISAEPKYQDYYNLKELNQSIAIDHFQFMCYDYGTLLESAHPARIEAHADIGYTKQLLQGLIREGISPQKMSIGFPLYSRSFILKKKGLKNEEVEELLKKGQLTSNGAPSSIVSDDATLKALGSWDQPKNGWALLTDEKKPPNFYAYHEKKGEILSLFPPKAMKAFAQMMRKEFPDIRNFFSWDAQLDSKGIMMGYLIDQIEHAKKV